MGNEELRMKSGGWGMRDSGKHDLQFSIHNSQFIILLSLVLLLSFRQDYGLQPGHQLIEQETDYADVNQCQNNFTYLVILVSIPDEETNTNNSRHHNLSRNNG